MNFSPPQKNDQSFAYSRTFSIFTQFQIIIKSERGQISKISMVNFLFVSNNVTYAKRIVPGSTDFTVPIFKIPPKSEQFSAMLATLSKLKSIRRKNKDIEGSVWGSWMFMPS